jgi:hypothetical protein
MKKIAGLLLAAILLSPSISLSQWTDYGAWASVSVNQKIAKKTYYNLDAAMRWDRDLTRLGSTFINADISRKLSDLFDATASIRLGASRTDEYLWESQKRVAAIIKFKMDLAGDFSFSLRAQGQTGFKGALTPDLDFSKATRTKATLYYKFSKDWRFSISGETFFRPVNDTYQWSDTRGRISARFKVSKRRYATFSYQLERPRLGNDPWTEHTIICNFAIQKKRRKTDN